LLQFFVMSTKRTVMGGDLWRVDGQEWVNWGYKAFHETRH
jgi:hypothetical protein